MAEQMTCGKGLAERSTLPAKLSELTAALAGVLERHEKSIGASEELTAYQTLSREYRSITAQLNTTAARMKGHRDLSMPQHDIGVLKSPANVDAFANFVKVEHELLDLLRDSLQRDQKMLEGMRGM